MDVKMEKRIAYLRKRTEEKMTGVPMHLRYAEKDFLDDERRRNA